jgi:transposase
MLPPGAPYAPRLMMGLILYGVMQGVHSLRELERLAGLDLGCMWVTGGIAPDPANIGRFVDGAPVMRWVAVCCPTPSSAT